MIRALDVNSFVINGKNLRLHVIAGCGSGARAITRCEGRRDKRAETSLGAAAKSGRATYGRLLTDGGAVRLL